jgi:hypothetical protein
MFNRLKSLKFVGGTLPKLELKFCFDDLFELLYQPCFFDKIAFM